MAQIFVSAVAHFFVVVGGSKIHERLAHFFIDIYNDEVQRRLVKPEHFNWSTTTFPNMLFCSDCGGLLTAFPAHSTTYNDILWRCANLRLRNSHCTTPMLFEELLISIFREIIITVLDRNPGIMRECITALKAVSNTPTAFNKRIILNSVTTNTIPTVSEKYMWRTVIEKVIVHPGHLLEFHLRNGTILPYQMFRVSPRMCRLSKPAQEEIRKAYTQGESVTSIAQRLNISKSTVKTIIKSPK